MGGPFEHLLELHPVLDDQLVRKIPSPTSTRRIANCWPSRKFRSPCTDTSLLFMSLSYQRFEKCVSKFSRDSSIILAAYPDTASVDALKMRRTNETNTKFDTFESQTQGNPIWVRSSKMADSLS